MQFSDYIYVFTTMRVVCTFSIINHKPCTAQFNLGGSMSVRKVLEI